MKKLDVSTAECFMSAVAGQELKSDLYQSESKQLDWDWDSCPNPSWTLPTFLLPFEISYLLAASRAQPAHSTSNIHRWRRKWSRWPDATPDTFAFIWLMFLIYISDHSERERKSVAYFCSLHTQAHCALKWQVPYRSRVCLFRTKKMLWRSEKRKKKIFFFYVYIEIPIRNCISPQYLQNFKKNIHMSHNEVKTVDTWNSLSFLWCDCNEELL